MNKMIDVEIEKNYIRIITVIKNTKDPTRRMPILFTYSYLIRPARKDIIIKNILNDIYQHPENYEEIQKYTIDDDRDQMTRELTLFYNKFILNNLNSKNVS